MPAAVESLLGSFLKFEDRNAAALGEAFGEIDDNLARLLTADPAAFGQIAHDPDVHLDFNLIGRTFTTIGQDFHKGAQAGALIDNFALKGFGLNKGDDPTGPQSDFLAFDRLIEESAKDLKEVGGEFLRLTTARSADALDARLDDIAGNFVELGGDMAANSDALEKLAGDFMALGDLPNPESIQESLKAFGAELQTVADRFDGLSQDFGQLSTATETAPGTVGPAFQALMQNFHFLGAEAGELGVQANALLADLGEQQHPQAAAGGTAAQHSSTSV